MPARPADPKLEAVLALGIETMACPDEAILIGKLLERVSTGDPSLEGLDPKLACASSP